MVVGLGASALAVGVIEGIAEATALITKVFSGALSDRLGKRKLLAVLKDELAPKAPESGSRSPATRWVQRPSRCSRWPPGWVRWWPRASSTASGR